MTPGSILFGVVLGVILATFTLNIAIITLPLLGRFAARRSLDEYKALAVLACDEPVEVMLYSWQQRDALLPTPSLVAMALRPYSAIYVWNRDFEAWGMVYEWARRGKLAADGIPGPYSTDGWTVKEEEKKK